MGVRGSSEKKVFGFFNDRDAGVWSQVNAVCAKLRSRSWALSKLKKCGLDTEELIKVYKTCIRPCADYAWAVLHPMLSLEQSELIEAQQTNALWNIYGFGITAAKMRKRSGMPTLAERRFSSCKRFAKSTHQKPTSQTLGPPARTYRLRASRGHRLQPIRGRNS